MEGDRATITLSPSPGWIVDSVSGCGEGGSLSGNVRTTGQIEGDCDLQVRFAIDPEDPGLLISG